MNSTAQETRKRVRVPKVTPSNATPVKPTTVTATPKPSAGSAKATQEIPAEVLAGIRAVGISSRTSWLALGRKVLEAQKLYPWLTTKGLASALKDKYGAAVTYLSESSLSKASTVAHAYAGVSDVDLAQRTLGFWYAAYQSFIVGGRMTADAVVSGLLAGALKIPKAGHANRAVTLPIKLVEKLHKARGSKPLAEFLESLLK